MFTLKNFYDIIPKKGGRKINDKITDFEKLKSNLKNNFGINYLELNENLIDQNLIQIITHEIASQNNILPIKKENNYLTLAMENPLDIKTIDNIELITNFSVIPVLSNPHIIEKFINHYYSNSKIDFITSQFLNQKNTNESKNTEINLEKDIKNAPAVKLIDSLLEMAINYRASDIHIEPYEKIIRTRYRIDGHLKEFEIVDIALLSNIISRLKIISNMDIGEKRLPQDGHFRIDTEENKIDFRISTIGTIFGEKAVIRLIYTDKKILEKSELGFFEEDIEKINLVLKNKSGAILVTGPTGSGKSTTLSSFLLDLNKENKNIVTIEDPVENIIFGINQININKKIGLDFSNILSYILRQDPDIIMVGEIRDPETANLVITSSITGHLVLSTLHTNSAIETITRLVNMEVEKYLLTNAIKSIISQRLVRKLCDFCKTETKITKEQTKFLKINEGTKVFEKCGCEKCNNTGYKGRFAIYEIIILNDELIEIIEKNYSNKFLKDYLQSKNFQSILECGIKNILIGKTSVDEIIDIYFST